MKRLFHETYETYTPEAVEISKEIGAEIREMIHNYCNKQNYSVNDVGQILADEVNLNISEFKLLRNMMLKKKERGK